MHGRGQYGPRGAAIVAQGGPGRKKGPRRGPAQNAKAPAAGEGRWRRSPTSALGFRPYWPSQKSGRPLISHQVLATGSHSQASM